MAPSGVSVMTCASMFTTRSSCCSATKLQYINMGRAVVGSWKNQQCSQPEMALRTEAHVSRMSPAATLRRSFLLPLKPPSSPELKPYSTTARHFYERVKPQMFKGEYAPVFVAVGMITMSVGFGLLTVAHQLKWAPNVQVSKSTRKSLPEVEAPEEVAEKADKFVKRSFFRNVAHVQDSDRKEVMSDPIRGDAYAKEWPIETLKDAGVEPSRPASA